MNKEKISGAINGWRMAIVVILITIITIFSIFYGINSDEILLFCFLIPIPATILNIFFAFGFFTLQPNEAQALVLFGSYKGTVKKSGFHWANPLKLPFPREKYNVSLRSRNIDGEKLKVNDKRGNPIEISAVVVWKIEDTAQSLFDVDNYLDYVRIQSESAVRHLANAFPYDHGEGDEITLRSGSEEISETLKKELQERLGKAGVLVEEARLNHLAYAPEIASAMLRRQQAEAVIAARQKIVQGAVTMVESALQLLSEKKVIDLDDERKAAMISNLMVVLCGENEAHPVINTGTLYT